MLAGLPPSRTDLFLDAQRQALEMIVRGAPLRETLGFLTSVVEAQNPDVVASILFLDDEGRLRDGAAPSLPDAYNAAIDGLKAEPTLGTCSAAAATGQVVITTDFATDPGWVSIKHLPLALGLRAAWSQPIVDGEGRVLGTFGTYFRECREPLPHERRAVEILSHTAALAIERARTEEALRDADRRKNEFIATLSHELRNPLAALRTGLQLLGKAKDDPAAVGRLHVRMVRQVDQLVRLVDDLTDVTRITRGEPNLQIERVDATAIVRLAVETSESLVQASRHELTLQLPETPLWVTGDAVRLAQIVANLISNAAKYTNEGGSIVVEARARDASVEIRVRDSGVGLAPGDIDRVFQMFARGSHDGVRAQWGLGIGLALARQLAELHGGSLHAVSEGPGRGSEFTLRLPAAAAETAAPVETRAS